MEVSSFSPSQVEGGGEKTNFNPCHEEGIQTSLLFVVCILSTLIAR